MAPGSHLGELPRPTLVVVDDEDTSRAALARALTTRYGTDYSVLVESSPVEALQRLRNVGAAGEEVAVILANPEMAEMPGGTFLSAAHEIYPRARRGLLSSRRRRTSSPAERPHKRARWGTRTTS
jgi:thioredoxin reductase (NADPH)